MEYLIFLLQAEKSATNTRVKARLTGLPFALASDLRPSFLGAKSLHFLIIHSPMHQNSDN